MIFTNLIVWIFFFFFLIYKIVWIFKKKRNGKKEIMKFVVLEMRGRVTSERMFDACQHVAYLSHIRIPMVGSQGVSRKTYWIYRSTGYSKIVGPYSRRMNFPIDLFASSFALAIPVNGITVIRFVSSRLDSTDTSSRVFSKFNTS